MPSRYGISISVEDSHGQELTEYGLQNLSAAGRRSKICSTMIESKATRLSLFVSRLMIPSSGILLSLVNQDLSKASDSMATTSALEATIKTIYSQFSQRLLKKSKFQARRLILAHSRLLPTTDLPLSAWQLLCTWTAERSLSAA